MGFFNSTPSYYRGCTFPVRNGVFYVGGSVPVVGLTGSGATGYEVRDYYGAVVSSGSMSSSATSCTPTAPTGGWGPGWYRMYFTGPTNDTTVGYAVAATCFTVVRPDSHFPTMPAAVAPTAVGGGNTYYGNEYADPVAKGVMGMGHSRHIIGSYATPTTGTDTITSCLAQLAQSKTYWSQPGSPYADAARPRPLWCATPGECADVRTLAGASSGTFLRVYAATGSVDSSRVFIATEAGSASGTKVTVYSPNSSTVVETYDNLASDTAAAAAINAASAYVKVFAGGQASAQGTSPTAIGRTVWNGIASVVTALYPDVTRYEFTNEPSINAETAHKMRLFQAAVHAANPSAIAIGPCSVAISNLTAFAEFFAAGGGTYCDEISFHDYSNLGNGDMPKARAIIQAFQALLSSYSLSGKTLWQTEAGAAFSAVSGVHHPRRARVKMLHTLLWEQYGIPRERNPMWYDVSHGFWNYPMWWQYGDSSLTADAILHRVLAEETWGMTHQSRLQFGTLGDRVALGSVYGGTAGQCVVLQAASYMPNATVTLTTSAVGSLTVSDAFGVTSSATVSNGRVTIPVAEVPTYLRLPVGATVSAYQYMDWPPVALAGAWTSSSRTATVVASSGDNTCGYMNDDSWAATGIYYGYGLDGGNYDAGMPDQVVFRWPTATRVDRVLLWCGPAFSSGNTLVDFDVQTSNDGTTWTTQATVTRPTPSSFLFGTNSTNTWCTRETYWDEQWIFDVKLPAPVTARFLRLYVRDASLGGEPDLAALLAGGQGWNKRIALAEVAVLCDANTLPQFVRQ